MILAYAIMIDSSFQKLTYVVCSHQYLSIKLNLSDLNDKKAESIITDVPLAVGGVWTL